MHSVRLNTSICDPHPSSWTPGKLISDNKCTLTGLWYGKLEAGILTFVIPILLLGHVVIYISEVWHLSSIRPDEMQWFNYMLSEWFSEQMQYGLMDDGAKLGPLGLWMPGTFHCVRCLKIAASQEEQFQ
jgi:hypothetical protein